MVYRDFTLSKVKADFDLRIDETVDLFTGVEAIAPSELLSLTLKETIPLLSTINTEKVHSLVNHCPNTLGGETTAPILGQFISHI